MSVEEEVELRDLVAQTLELNGCLPKIRAQLRANLFLALDEDSKISKQQPLLNKKIKSYLEVPEGQLMFCLVREFLEYFDLDFTVSVYEPESYMGSFYKYEGRQKIIEDLGLKSTEDNYSSPVLLHLVKIAQMKSKTLKINLTNINGGEVKETNGSSSVSTAEDGVNGHSDLSEAEENSVSNRNGHNVNEEQVQPLNVKKLASPSSCVKGNYESKEVTKEALNSTYVKRDEENDDTFNGTSSIEEETVNGVESSKDLNQKFTTNEEESAASTDAETSPESKSKLEDKSKSSMKSDKLKSKLELPPLQLNKSRGSDILPSLYSKDFKERGNKDFDFDIKDDYEEDFMSGSEMDFSLSHVDCPKPLLEELQQCSEYASNLNSVISKSKQLSIVNQQQNSRNSNSDNKLINDSNTTDNIETSLSMEGETGTNSNHTNSQVNNI
ncbi:centrosomal protein 43-like [Tenebrio molitor]|uniref:centrosomal protein 43-like n=1 Tax=Tenebrio molitor TaxID=7067 RepID=UPI0036249379